jgi:hypothetical protein
VLGLLGCATVKNADNSLVPSKFQARTGPFALYANKPVAADAKVVRDLLSLELDVESHLGIRVNDEVPSVEVYILHDRDAFNHFLTFYYPELPPRRAFFLAQGSRRVIYTYYNDRLDEDLRHEATHALLNVAVGDLPLWLDEGLAEYFEGPTGKNAEHLGRLPDDQKAGWKPDLARLETLKSVRDMTPLDYRESWAWIHYLLNSTPADKKVLLAYLAQPREPSAVRGLLSANLAKTDPTAPALVLTHLDQLRSETIAAKPTTAEPSIHFQDAPLDAATRPAPRRGFFDRVFSALGLW